MIITPATSNPAYLWAAPREPRPLKVCEHCGGLRTKSPLPHAPRLVLVGGVWRSVDCAGREVSR
jgi:hypothetical protein